MELVHLSCVLVVFSVLGTSVYSSCAEDLELCLARITGIVGSVDPTTNCRAIRSARVCLTEYDFCPQKTNNEVNVARFLRSRLDHCEVLYPEDKGRDGACGFNNVSRCLGPLDQMVRLKTLVATRCQIIRKVKECLRDLRKNCKENKALLSIIKSENKNLMDFRDHVRCHTRRGRNRYTGGSAHSRNEPRISIVGPGNVNFYSPIELICIISPSINLPDKRVIWSKNGRPMGKGWKEVSEGTERNNTLYSRHRVSLASFRHTGVYTCASKSSPQLKARKRVKVSFVEGITGPSKVAVGSTFQFICRGLSPDKSDAYWLKDGKNPASMSRGGEVSVYHIGDGYHQYSTYDFKEGAMESDAGVYECFVSNKTFTISLDVVTASPSTSKSTTTVITTQSTATTQTGTKPSQFPETTELNKAATNEFESGQDAQTEYFLSQIQLNKVQMEVELRNQIELDLEILEEKIEIGLVDFQDRNRLVEEILSPLD